MCYGPEQVQNRFLLFSIGVCLENGDIKISSGEQFRRYCFIDVVDAVFFGMTNNAGGKIFNIALLLDQEDQNLLQFPKEQGKTWNFMRM